MSRFLQMPVESGRRHERRVPIGEFSDGTVVTLPVVTIQGAKPGPTFYLQAGLHGDEDTGMEVCRRVISGLHPKELRGTFVSVPVANVPAYISRSRGFLHEERGPVDLNRTFPGNPHGLLSERLTHLLFDEFIKQSDFTIDMHSALAGCDIASYVYVTPDDDDNNTLEARMKAAYAFGTPYVYHKKRTAKLGTSDMSRALSSQADEAGIPTMTAELGESGHITAEVVPEGVRGVRNVMKALGMLEGEVDITAAPQRFDSITLVHAQRGGALQLDVTIGDLVKAGQQLGRITDLFGNEVEAILAPREGFVLRAMRRAAIGTGAEVLWVGA